MGTNINEEKKTRIHAFGVKVVNYCSQNITHTVHTRQQCFPTGEKDHWTLGTDFFGIISD